MAETEEFDRLAAEPGAAEEFDVIVVGAGQAGGPLARAFARAGRQTALIERAHVGGTCINEGCTPTKTMVASARAAYVARRAGEYGIPATVGPTEMSTVRQRKQAVVDDFRNSSRRRLEAQENLDLIWGEAAFVGERLIAVRPAVPMSRTGPTAPITADRTRRLTAPIIAINTGARPALPNLNGLENVPYLDSTSIMELDTVPEHLMVLGGGYVGLEFAQMFRRFGSRVTVMERSGHVLSREDADVVEEVEKILGDEGIEFIFNAEARAVLQEQGTLRLHLAVDGIERAVDGTHLLVATGRVPNTDRLGLAAGGIDVDERGFVKVDECLKATAEGVYALGDVKGGPAFTHISYDDYRIVEANLIKGGTSSTSSSGGEKRTTEGRLVPYTVFIDPQLGCVGMTESEARSSGRNVKVAKLPMANVARAIETDETRGFMKAVVDADTEEILGCAVLGIDGGEIMGALQIAMMGKLRYTQLRDAVFAHPTLIESLNNLFMTLD